MTIAEQICKLQQKHNKVNRKTIKPLMFSHNPEDLEKAKKILESSEIVNIEKQKKELGKKLIISNPELVDLPELHILETICDSTSDLSTIKISVLNPRKDELDVIVFLFDMNDNLLGKIMEY